MKKSIKSSKKRHFIAVLSLFCSLSAMAQNTVYYSYDASGNRVKREIVLNRQNAPQPPGCSPYYSDQLAADYSIKIHPSVSDGTIHVEVLSKVGSYEGTVTAYSLAGAKVQECKVENGNAYIQLGDSPKGVYILHVEINGKSTDWKIIKK